MQPTLKMEQNGKITWGELKKLIEENGVAEDDEIDRIDISYDDDFGWQIYL